MKSNMISISLFSFFDEYTHVSPLLIKVCLPSPMLSTLRNVLTVPTLQNCLQSHESATN